MQAQASETHPAEEMDDDELEDALDDLSDRLYNDKFTRADMVSARVILGEMKDRDMELPGEKIGVDGF